MHKIITCCYFYWWQLGELCLLAMVLELQCTCICMVHCMVLYERDWEGEIWYMEMTLVHMCVCRIWILSGVSCSTRHKPKRQTSTVTSSLVRLLMSPFQLDYPTGCNNYFDTTYTYHVLHVSAYTAPVHVHVRVLHLHAIFCASIASAASAWCMCTTCT